MPPPTQFLTALKTAVASGSTSAPSRPTKYCLAKTLGSDAADKGQDLSVADSPSQARRILDEFSADKEWLAALAAEGAVFAARD
jgi:hypothetical protein